MTPKQIVHKLEWIRPVEPEDLEGFIPFTHLDSGYSRDVYHISNSRVVIKFPTCRSSIHHSRQELRVIGALTTKKKFKHLARYCPKIFYQDYQNGVLAMELLSDVGGIDPEVCRVLEKVFQDTLGSRVCLDFMGDNLGRNSHEQIKILDFGCVRGQL